MKKVILFGLAVLLVSCEKPIMDYDEKIGHEEDANVTLRFLPDQQDGFDTRGTALADQLTRLSVAIFRQDGTKLKSINQQQDDADFGRVDVLLEPGTYRVVAVAHNSTEGSATISSTEKVTFANNKMSDTFACCASLTVEGEEPIDQELLLQRVVAMVRLTVTGTIPDEVARLKFYYTGGSSTLNPSTGYGCVQSKQTEYRPVVLDGSPVNTFELYTAPHELNDVLKLVITAQDSDNQTLNEWTMENIPITRNKITTWTGTLFSGGGGTGGGTGSGGINIALDTQWDGTISYTW
ncbi:MAG: FimB/Mfa2 family fimbrial subunit [Bacteroidaceae bacterium]|nr:FimB/Mfa2 family fimbrial subunit [Bacteroidaceae bacterium]